MTAFVWVPVGFFMGLAFAGLMSLLFEIYADEYVVPEDTQFCDGCAELMDRPGDVFHTSQGSEPRD